MLALVLSNWKPVAIAIALMAGLVYHTASVREARHQGREQERAAIRAANDAAAKKADNATAGVDACAAPRRWNRETGRCEQ